jgi:phosphatidylglycerophosphatase A
MPGTAGAFLGTIFSYFLFKTFGGNTISVVCIGLIIFAIYVCSVAERAFCCKDPRCVILDEFVAMPVCFLFQELKHVIIFLLGFLIFRAFDILKPLGIKFFERFRSGWGIVLDDVIAACYTNIVLRVLLHVYQR